MIRKTENRAMTTVKKGHLALAQEWRKHLRDLKRLYWKRERRAGVTEAAHQVSAVSQATGTTWTVKRLYQSVRRLVAEGLVDRKLLGRAARVHRRRSEELAVLVQGIALANPGLSLRGIGGQLEAMKIRTPAGKPSWTPTSVAHLLKKVTGAPSH
jgi:hypothetical protein